MLTKRHDKYTLTEQVRQLCQQGETGRLTLVYGEGSGTLYFENGELVDASMAQLSGVQAIFLALTIPDLSFSFSPLFRPSRRTIIEPWEIVFANARRQLDEGALPGELILEENEFEAAWSQLTDPSKPAGTSFVVYRDGVRRALPFAGLSSLAFARLAAAGRREIALALSMLIFMVLTTVSIVALNNRFIKHETPVIAAPMKEVKPEATTAIALSTAPEAAASPAAPQEIAGDPQAALEPAEAQPEPVSIRRNRPARELHARLRNGAAEAEYSPAVTEPAPVESRNALVSDNAAATSQAPTIMVLVQVRNGMASTAFIPHRRPNMESYESAALRTAAQRRFPNSGDGAWETLLIKVDRPDK